MYWVTSYFQKLPLKGFIGAVLMGISHVSLFSPESQVAKGIVTGFCLFTNYFQGVRVDLPGALW